MTQLRAPAQMVEDQVVALGDSLTVSALGGWQQVAAAAAGLVDSTTLPVVCDLVAGEFEAFGNAVPQDAGQAAVALAEAVAATRRVGPFADALHSWVTSPAVIHHVGRHLTGPLLQIAGRPGADGQSAALAAVALAASTRVRQDGLVARWDLYSLLDDIDGPRPPAYARAVLRACLRCAMTWAEYDTIAVARRLAGLDESSTTSERWWLEDIHDDAAVTLAHLHLWAALRAASGMDSREHLRHGQAFADLVDPQERPDAAAIGVVLTLLADLLDEPLVIPHIDITTITSAVLEQQHYDGPWDDDEAALGAIQLGWARLAVGLDNASDRLAADSWYRPADEIARIVDLVVAIGSRVHVGTDGVRRVLTPALGAGFGRNAALLAHLKDHIAEVRAQAESPARAQELAVCRELLERTRSELVGVLAPKQSAGEGPDVTSPASAERHRLLLGDQTRIAQPRSIGVDDAVREVLNRLQGVPDFDVVGPEATLVTEALLRYAAWCIQSQPSDEGFLFGTRLDEKALRESITRYLHANDLLHGHLQEVPRQGGGRVDILALFSGFGLAIELKVDDDPSVADHEKYVKQAAAYQAAGVRISFLVTLARLRPKATPPLLRSVVEVLPVTDSSNERRTVVSIVIHANRKPPSKN